MSESGRTEAADPAHILVRGVNWLGDTIMTLPALRRLRERYPAAQITVAARHQLAPLLSNAHIIRVATFLIQDEQSPLAVSRSIRSLKPDLAILFPNSDRAALEVWLAGVPRRVGYTGGWRGLFLTQRVTRANQQFRMKKLTKSEILRRIAKETPRQTWPSSAHQVHEYLGLVAAVGTSSEAVEPVLDVPAEEIRRVAGQFELTGTFPGSRPLFGLNPGAEYGPAKRWPAERFISAAHHLTHRMGVAWLLFGGRGDVALCGAIEAGLRKHQVPCMNLAGRTSILDLCALLKLCRVLLTNDTGPMHLSAAVGTPVVAPFGSTSPELTGPGLPATKRHQLLRGEVPCAPCFLRECPIDHRCMKSITVSRVVDSVAAAAAPR